MQWLPLLPRMSLQLWGFRGGGTWTREHRLSSCDAWASLFCSMWDLLRPESEPMSPVFPLSHEGSLRFVLNYFSSLCAVLCLVAQSCLTLCNPKDCSPPGYSVHGDSPGKSTGVDCHALLQETFPTQELSRGLLSIRRILHQLSYQPFLHYTYV